MFRRKDEQDGDIAENNPQGSLLAGSADTVNVLSPQQAAQYSAGQPSQSAAANTSASAAIAPTGAPSFGQIARPIQPEAPRSPSTSFRPASSPASQPVNDVLRRPESASRTSPYSAPSTFGAPSKDGRRILTVGSEILLKGEITTCDRLVIEGKVDATVKDVHTLELSEAGSFKGHAEVEYAEISGKFEGELIVKSTLVIHSTGTINGKITYGEIEIQRGGEITGEIQTVGMKAASVSKKKEAA